MYQRMLVLRHLSTFQTCGAVSLFHDSSIHEVLMSFKGDLNVVHFLNALSCKIFAFGPPKMLIWKMSRNFWDQLLRRYFLNGCLWIFKFLIRIISVLFPCLLLFISILNFFKHTLHIACNMWCVARFDSICTI